MARASDLLRNFYSGSQIGSYALPKLNSFMQSLLPAKSAERGQVPSNRFSLNSSNPFSGSSPSLGLNKDPDALPNLFSSTPTGSSPMVTPKVSTGIEKVAGGTVAEVAGEDADSGFLGDAAKVIKDVAPFGGFIGGVLGMFGGGQESPEEIARRRIDAYTSKLSALRDYETKTVSSTLSQDTASAMRQASQIASRQAAALGKTEQTASFAMPATTNIAVAGGRNMKQAVQGIQSRFNSQIADAEASMFGVPAEESFSDVMANVGETMAARSQQEDFFTRLEKLAAARDKRLGYA
jgi:hypothetical protein